MLFLTQTELLAYVEQRVQEGEDVSIYTDTLNEQLPYYLIHDNNWFEAQDFMEWLETVLRLHADAGVNKVFERAGLLVQISHDEVMNSSATAPTGFWNEHVNFVQIKTSE